VFLRRRIGRLAEIRRMRDLVAACGAEAIGREAGLAPVGLPRTERIVHPRCFLGVHPLGTAAFVGVGLTFGRITAADAGELALAAAANGARDLRLTPWRAILLPAPSLSAAHAVSAGLVGRSFIRDPDDPFRRIAACPGAPSCGRGSAPVRRDAARLAAEIAGVPGCGPSCGIVLHVSGCEKGCAHPRPATVTLVGRNGRYDLVRDGVASGAPALRNMTLDQAAQQVRHIVAPTGVDTDSPPVPPKIMPVPGLDPGTRCTSVSDCLSMTCSGTDGRSMSGHDDAGKAASVSLSTPTGITSQPRGGAA
jgi:precorrin-3B synthase